METVIGLLGSVIQAIATSDPSGWTTQARDDYHCPSHVHNGHKPPEAEPLAP